MGIFSRLNRVIKSNLNALIDQAEDPDKLIGQTVADMKSALGRARSELIAALGSAKRLDKKEKELEAEAVEWERKALLALERDDEDLAREALRRKARTLKEAQQVRARAAEQATTADAMKGQLEQIEAKLDDLKARQELLERNVGVALGLGSYVTVPVGWAARRERIGKGLLAGSLVATFLGLGLLPGWLL